MQGDKSTLAKIGAFLGIVLTLTYIVWNVINIIEKRKEPAITVENKLALPIIVNINNGAYIKRIEAGTTQKITLLSDSEFPVHVTWEVIRNKYSNGQLMGEFLQAEYKKVDKGKILTATNQIGLQSYIYPKIINNTNQRCLIVINDGLTISYQIGTSSPHTQTNITGYYKYAANTNITVKCPNKTYWRGKRNGKTGPAITIEPDSGVVEFLIP